MRFNIITVFPEVYNSYLSASILNRAHKRKLISIYRHGLRDWGEGRHKQLDARPYGGGVGMVLMAEPILKAVAHVLKKSKVKPSRRKVILFSAKGKQFDQKLAYEWAHSLDQIIFITGRYEGIDERVINALLDSGIKAEEISIGPYVMTDGDVAAMAVISAVARLVPGVICTESLIEESHWEMGQKNEYKNITEEKKLEYPHYTRPEVLTFKSKKFRVPKVLLSGDHKKIADWRHEKSL